MRIFVALFLFFVLISRIVIAGPCEKLKNSVLFELKKIEQKSAKKMNITTSKGIIALSMKTINTKEELKNLLKKLGFEGYKMLITDIDNTLLDVTGGNDLGNKTPELEKFVEIMNQNAGKILFGVATGRDADKAIGVMYEHGMTSARIIISRVGTEIDVLDYENRTIYSYKPWFDYLKASSPTWDAKKIGEIIGEHFKEIEAQPTNVDNVNKSSYYLKDQSPYTVEQIENVLKEHGIKDFQAIYSSNWFLDFLPIGAGKSICVATIMKALNIPAENVLTADDSGNGSAMLDLKDPTHGVTRKVNGVVPANHTPDLSYLKSVPTVFFSNLPYTGALIDALQKLGWIK